MNSWYWKNLLNSGMEAGLKVKKVGLLNVDQPVDQHSTDQLPIFLMFNQEKKCKLIYCP
jgi:hypothetical protein